MLVRILPPFANEPALVGSIVEVINTHPGQPGWLIGRFVDCVSADQARYVTECTDGRVILESGEYEEVE